LDMKKEIKALIAVDGSESSMDAVCYVSRFMDPAKTSVTLIHILADLPEALLDIGDSPLFDAPDLKAGPWQAKMAQSVRKKMEEAEKILVEAGYPNGSIQIKIEDLKKGVAKDIASESAMGYDAVFVGRRGHNDPTDIIVGSTAYKLVSGIHHLPVVVVGDKPDPDNILIGFDGSEDASKAVACACALMPKPGRKVMLCHVLPPMNMPVGDQEIFTPDQEQTWIEKGRERIESAILDARQQLANAGFDAGLIDTQVITGKISRAVAIAKTAESSGYGTIIVGRRGLTVIKEFLMGRVTLKVLHRAYKMAVWIA
jgi:nucleotide-binding universal stress UspA family protein